MANKKVCINCHERYRTPNPRGYVETRWDTGYIVCPLKVFLESEMPYAIRLSFVPFDGCPYETEHIVASDSK